MHTLVLLPMNTTKIDVYEYVNLKVQRICDKRGISRTRFWNYRGRNIHMYKFHHMHNFQSASIVGNTSAP
jgi:hypothetical protein